MSKKLKKNCTFCQKHAKIRNVETIVRGRSHSENLTFSALLCEQKPRAPQYSFAQLTASQL